MAKLWLQISKRKHLLQGVKVIVSSGRKNWDILMRSFEKKNKNCQNLPFISKIFSNKKIGILFVLFSATWRTNSAQNNVTMSGLWDRSRHQRIDSQQTYLLEWLLWIQRRKSKIGVIHLIRVWIVFESKFWLKNFYPSISINS